MCIALITTKCWGSDRKCASEDSLRVFRKLRDEPLVDKEDREEGEGWRGKQRSDSIFFIQRSICILCSRWLKAQVNRNVEVKIPIVCNTFPSTASSPPGPPPHGWTGNYGGSSKCVILLLSSTDKAKLLHGSRDLHLPKALLRHGTHRSPPPPSPWRSSNQLSIISSTKQPLSSRTVYTLLACQYEINY